MKKSCLAVLRKMTPVFALAALCATIDAPRGARAQAPPPAPTVEYEGVIGTALALRRLGQTARVLHVGAHPDDENTALFSPLALGRGVDVAYLSLNRGEGGQNGIGPELGIPLGLIRTEELLAARRLDGATQFFTRAIDFGFSKDARETFTHWPRDLVLADVVAVIRMYRPDIVIPAWSGTRRDGHGQHEAAGILTREAVLAAADPARFPEQLAAGLRPHAVTRYYWSARYGADGPDIELDTGTLDALLGRSYHQVAMASRSRHRSQDMGVPQAPGPRHTAFDRVDPADPPEVAMSSAQRPARQLEGEATASTSLLAGIDTLLSQRAEGVAPEAVEHLREYEAVIARVQDEVPALRSGAATPLLGDARATLARARRVVDQLRPRAGSAEADRIADIRFHLAAEARDLDEATLAAANLRFDAASSAELVTPGGTFELALSIWNGGAAVMDGRAEPILPDGWTSRLVGGSGPASRVLPGQLKTWHFTVTVGDDADLTHPYFLSPRDPSDDEAMYAGWPEPGLIGRPFAPAPVRGRFVSTLSPGAEITTERDAAWVGLDARSGEFRRPVRVVPAASVSIAPAMTVVPGSTAGRALSLTVRLRGAPASAADAPSGSVRLVAPDGWTVRPESREMTLDDAAERAVSFQVTPTADIRPGVYDLRAEFRSGDQTYDLGYELIDYPHIAPHHVYRPAAARVRVLDVQVADVRVGYVEGVGDGVPEALDQFGLEWEALDAAALAEADLGRFDVIVAGTRAYELRPDLVAHNRRLLDWARAGGTLISLYNKYPALAGSYAPWPVTIARPHGRVTDENAPVTVLDPDHPLFSTPNRIRTGDWDGWVQERGLYFWETWQGPLRPLLAMSDPGEAPLEGSLLVAPLGEGIYAYSALAFFRQLPAGVPGAYRLFANLVSLGAER